MNIEQISLLLEKTAAHIELLEQENTKLREQIKVPMQDIEGLDKEASSSPLAALGIEPDIVSLGTPSSQTAHNLATSQEQLENFLTTLS